MDYLYTENAGKSHQRDAAGDTVFCESNGDFILPDYLPEIRKILQVTTDLVPVGKYVGGGRAAFSGNCCHTVTYLDGEGKVASAPLTAPYEVSVPLLSKAWCCGNTAHFVLESK